MKRIRLSNQQYSRIAGDLKNIAIIETCENLAPKKEPKGTEERRNEVQDKVTKEVIVGFNGYVREQKTSDGNTMYILYTERRFIPELQVLFKKKGVPFNVRGAHHFDKKLPLIKKVFANGESITV